MFDIGWLELIVIGIVALIVVGPKDLPGMFRTMGQFMGKMRGMAREFQRTMEQAADESGLNEATSSIRKMGDFGNAVRNPAKAATSYAQSMAKDIKDAVDEVEAPASTPTAPEVADLPKWTPPAPEQTGTDAPAADAPGQGGAGDPAPTPTPPPAADSAPAAEPKPAAPKPPEG